MGSYLGAVVSQVCHLPGVSQIHPPLVAWRLNHGRAPRHAGQFEPDFSGKLMNPLPLQAADSCSGQSLKSPPAPGK
jgi:hypothetical protein